MRRSLSRPKGQPPEQGLTSTVGYYSIGMLSVRFDGKQRAPVRRE